MATNRAAAAPVFSIGKFAPAAGAAGASTAVFQIGTSASQQPPPAMVFGAGSAHSSHAVSSPDLQGEGRTQGSPGSLTLPAGFGTAAAAGQGAAKAAEATLTETQPVRSSGVPQQPHQVQMQLSAQQQQESQQQQASLPQQHEAVGGIAAPRRCPSQKPAYKPPDILVRRHAAIESDMTLSLFLLDAT